MVDLQVGARMVHITLEPDPASSLSCSGCEHGDLPVHEYCRWQPMLGKAVLLQVMLRRVACPDCGTRMELVPWLERHARLTRRLADTASALCARMATAHVAALFGLHWSTPRGQPAVDDGVRDEGTAQRVVDRAHRMGMASRVDPIDGACKSKRDYRLDAVRPATTRLRARHRQPRALANAYRPTEGVNNKIKVIKRMAYGYRGNDDLFLKNQSSHPR